MEYLIKSAVAATDIAPSSGPSDQLFFAGEKSPTATLFGAFSYGEPVSTSPENALAPFSSGWEEGGSRGEPGEGAAPAPAFAVVAEEIADIAVREALLDRAMGPKRRKKSSEKLRRGRRPSEGLAFVARDASGFVIGTVRLWDVRLGEGGAAALLLGPLAVEPTAKNAGIGSALMRHAVAEAKRLGHGAVLLVGDAPYYGRFGFSAERTGALAMPGPYERHRLLALELKQGALDGAAGTIKAAGRKLKGQALDFFA